MEYHSCTINKSFLQLTYSITTCEQKLSKALLGDHICNDLKLLALVKVLQNTNDMDCPSKKVELKENNKRFMMKSNLPYSSLQQSSEY